MRCSTRRTVEARGACGGSPAPAAMSGCLRNTCAAARRTAITRSVSSTSSRLRVRVAAWTSADVAGTGAASPWVSSSASFWASEIIAGSKSSSTSASRFFSVEAACHRRGAPAPAPRTAMVSRCVPPRDRGPERCRPHRHRLLRRARRRRMKRSCLEGVRGLPGLERAPAAWFTGPGPRASVGLDDARSLCHGLRRSRPVHGG
jgi:hypothetical protein